MLANLENYSIKFFGRKEIRVYLEVVIELSTNNPFGWFIILTSNVRRGCGAPSEKDLSILASGDIPVYSPKISGTEGWRVLARSSLGPVS